MGQDVRPLPAVAAGKGPFHVRAMPSGSGGCCVLPGKVPGLFEVPLLSGSLQAFAIRVHELGHLGLLRSGALPSDVLPAMKRSKIHFGWIQFSLDVVVNSFMLACGIPEISQIQHWAGALPAGIPRWLAAMEFLRSEGLSSELTRRMSLHARAHFSRQDLELLCSAAQLLRQRGIQAGRVATSRAPVLSVKELLSLLAKLQKKFGPHSRTARYPPMDRTIVERLIGERASSLGLQLSQWGKMEIVEPPLVPSWCCAQQEG